tara:strand:+ start:47 stop:418 length:372 start_codon:yes stop_codon:yes gene_type:complete
MNIDEYETMLSSVFLKKEEYTDTKNSSYGKGRPNKKVSPEEDRYRKARVEVLRKLYEENEPNLEYTWVLPEEGMDESMLTKKGLPDHRFAHKEQILYGDEFSPFDDPNLEDIMPNREDFYGKR